MTEQTKAIFENPQLLRQKLGEFFDTQNEKTIEKYAVVGEKMFEKGNRQKLKMYFNEWGFGVWAAIVSLIIVIVSLTLKYFSVNISEQITFGALGIFEFVFLCNIYVVSYRKKGVFETVSTLLNWLFIAIPFALLVIFIFYALKERALDTSFIISIIIAIFCLLVSSKYFFAKQLVIKRVALLLDNTIKNSERDAISKFFFNKDEFKKGAGKNLFGVIIGTIFFIFFIIGITISGIQKFSQKEIVNLQNTTDNTEISFKKDKTQSQVSSIENARKLLHNNEKEKAIGILNKICDENNGEACYFLARAYETDDKIKALGLMEKACSLNSPQGCFEIGLFYQENFEFDKAYKYIKTACDNNVASACFELSWWHKKGEHVMKDEQLAQILENKAFALYDKECNKNEGVAICRFLGDQYTSKKNAELAKKYYDISCDGGFGVSCRALASLYEKGEIMPKDLAMAKEYYGRSCDSGEEFGCKEYKRLNN